MNLKLVLMELGNKLVTECGFTPNMPNYYGKPNQTTKPIVDFTNWLNETPSAREMLADMGLEYPVIKKSE